MITHMIESELVDIKHDAVSQTTRILANLSLTKHDIARNNNTNSICNDASQAKGLDDIYDSFFLSVPDGGVAFSVRSHFPSLSGFTML